MKLELNGEPLASAIFDAAQIAPDYEGVKCVIAIGESGGFVCSEILTSRPFDEKTRRMIATEAVQALDSSKIEGSREYDLVDVEGREVEIDFDYDEADPLSDEFVAMSEEELDQLKGRLPAPWGILATAVSILVMGFLVWSLDPHNPTMIAAFGLVAITFAAALYFILGAFRAKREHDSLADVMSMMIDRELERRKTLDGAVAKSARP